MQLPRALAALAAYADPAPIATTGRRALLDDDCVRVDPVQHAVQVIPCLVYLSDAANK